MAINFYEPKINELLQRVPYTDNILEKYDNVTYNIRFYMIFSEYQKRLYQERITSENNLYIKDNYKVIIAETGISSNYNVERLEVETVFTSKYDTKTSLSYSMNLILKEINDCSLTNKIAAISKILGYESYILQPFHIDIWFSGYEHGGSMKPVPIIGEVYTYEVYLSSVKTHLDDSGTVYNIKMTPSSDYALNKELSTLMNLGNFKSSTGTLDNIRESIENSVNKTYFENNKELLQYYPDKKIIEIKIEDLTGMDYTNDKNVVNITSEQNKVIAMDNNLSPKSSNSKIEVLFQPDNETTLQNIFQELCFTVPEMRDVVARPYYRIETIDNVQNQHLYKIYMTVTLKRDMFLKWSNKHLKQKIEGLNIDEEALRLSYGEMQYYSLLKMIAEQTLQKKYEFMFSGNNTSVLSMDTDIDKLWYMNVGTFDIVNTVTSSKEMDTDLNALIATLEQYYRNDKTKTELDIFLEAQYMGLKGVRSLARDGRLYLDDIYNSLSDASREKLLKERIIKEKNDVYSNNNITIKQSEDPSFKEQQIAKIGYTNLFGSGNLVSLKLTILGDPFWLRIPSDNAYYQKTNNPDPSKYYHFVFKLHPSVKQANEKGGYVKNETADITGIYQIIKSKSVFENGKFIQNLEGVIDKTFIHSSIVKV